MVGTLARNWSWVLVRGIAALLFGLITLFNPAISLAALVLVFGAYALVDGVFTIVAVIKKGRSEPYWAALLISGILGIGIGILTFIMPGITAIALLYLIAAWAVVIGIAEIVAAIRLRKEVKGEWVLILGGVLSAVSAIAGHELVVEKARGGKEIPIPLARKLDDEAPDIPKGSA